MTHFLRSRGQLWGLLWCLTVWPHGKIIRESFHLRALELKPDLSQDRFLSLPGVQTLWKLVRSWLMFSAAFRACWLSRGETRSVRGIEQERWFRELEFKVNFNQSQKDGLASVVLNKLQIKASVTRKATLTSGTSHKEIPGHPHFWVTGFKFKGSHDFRFDDFLE